VDFNLDRRLRLHTDPEYKNLYSWAINEIDAQGKRIGRDQIPWPWTLYFTATSCVLGDSFDIESQSKEEEATAPPKITQRQIIRLQLRPGRPSDDGDETSFSMFGTDRTIKSFQLEIHPIVDPAARQESCQAWGSVSWTDKDEIDSIGTTDDCVVFYLFVTLDTFARYGAKVAHGLVDEILLRVGSVAGFYSEWSPSISTNEVKVLTAGKEHEVTLPTGLDFKPPRLGEVGEAELLINRRLEFRKRAPEEMADAGTELAAPVMRSPAAGPRMTRHASGMFGMLDYRAYKLLWLICMPLRLIVLIASWAAVFVAIMFSASLDYSVPVRIVIAYAIWEGLGLVLLIVRGILFSLIKKAFFWWVDVVPAKAESVAEAKEMVIAGPLSWLGKKYLHDFSNWTEEDTDQFASLMNWRARLFFRSTERVRERISRFREIYKNTGKQPGDLSEAERQKAVADLDYTWFEKAIINPMAFWAIVRLAIIVIAIVSLDRSTV
jgi:hypothetical protein